MVGLKRNSKLRVHRGGYPFWFDDVPKGMSRNQYMKLSKSKPKKKSMKIWIRENKKNMKKYTKKKKRSRSRSRRRDSRSITKKSRRTLANKI